MNHVRLGGSTMVQLYIKEQMHPGSKRLIVKSENRRDLFIIEGDWGRKGNIIQLYTINGTRLIKVKQQTLSIFPKFKLFINDQPMGFIKKKPRLFREPYYDVTKFGWRASGNYRKQEYTVKCKRQLIMSVDKAVTSFGDFYSLDIVDPSHAALCCILAVIIDHFSINKQSHKKHEDQQQILQRQC